MVALALVATYLVFEYGRISAGYDVVDAGNERAAFEEHIHALDDEIAELERVSIQLTGVAQRRGFKHMQVWESGWRDRASQAGYRYIRNGR